MPGAYPVSEPPIASRTTWSSPNVQTLPVRPARGGQTRPSGPYRGQPLGNGLTRDVRWPSWMPPWSRSVQVHGAHDHRRPRTAPGAGDGEHDGPPRSSDVPTRGPMWSCGCGAAQFDRRSPRVTCPSCEHHWQSQATSGRTCCGQCRRLVYVGVVERASEGDGHCDQPDAGHQFRTKDRSSPGPSGLGICHRPPVRPWLLAARDLRRALGGGGRPRTDRPVSHRRRPSGPVLAVSVPSGPHGCRPAGL